MKTNKKILKWEIASALFVIFVGSAFHFIFAWSRYNPIVGAFSAVNESTWEHTKLAFFPILVFSLFQYPFVKKEFKNYFTVKTKELYSAVLLIIIIFYTYTGMLGTHFLWADILTFVIAVILAKAVPYVYLFNRKKENPILPIILIALLGLFFVYATFYPPKIQLFLDTPTGTYGIVKKSNQSTSSSMTEAQARLIAERLCLRGGESLSAGYYNENSKTWWFDAQLNEVKEGCNPACVVDETTGRAETNWRCTGLIPPPNEVVCTQDAKQCPDGSYVGRVAPSCEFAACPSSTCSCPTGYIQDGNTCNPACYYSTPRCLAPSLQCQ